MPYVCPVDATHDQFFARVAESEEREYDAEGQDLGEIRHTYEGHGRITPVFCLNCFQGDTPLQTVVQSNGFDSVVIPAQEVAELGDLLRGWLPDDLTARALAILGLPEPLKGGAF